MGEQKLTETEMLRAVLEAKAKKELSERLEDPEILDSLRKKLARIENGERGERVYAVEEILSVAEKIGIREEVEERIKARHPGEKKRVEDIETLDAKFCEEVINERYLRRSNERITFLRQGAEMYENMLVTEINNYFLFDNIKVEKHTEEIQHPDKARPSIGFLATSSLDFYKIESESEKWLFFRWKKVKKIALGKMKIELYTGRENEESVRKNTQLKSTRYNCGDGIGGPPTHSPPGFLSEIISYNPSFTHFCSKGLAKVSRKTNDFLGEVFGDVINVKDKVIINYDPLNPIN